MTPVELNHESYMKYLLNYEYRERGGETGETGGFYISPDNFIPCLDFAAGRSLFRPRDQWANVRV